MEVTPLTKDDQLADTRRDKHLRGCDCKPCVGRRSRARGMKKQRTARKLMKVPNPRFSSQNSNEEAWQGAVRCEVKSGANDTNPIATRFLAAERQSEASRAIGDTRPFVHIAMPPGFGSEGIVSFRLSDIARVVGDLNEVFEQWD
jgi:hypothetical protein